VKQKKSPQLGLKDRFENYLTTLAEIVTEALQEIEGRKSLRTETWDHPAGGGGTLRHLKNGKVFESAIISNMVLMGELSETLQRTLHTGAGWFYTAEITIELHPINPMVPSAHMTLRYVELRDKQGNESASNKAQGVRDGWYSGSVTLTPTYVWEDDVIHFHSTLKASCEEHHPEYYALFKDACDEYYFLQHRSEPRGAGGLHFDHLRAEDGFTQEDRYEFVTTIGDIFTDAYLPVVERRYAEPYNDEQRTFQEFRRGRYAEFALLYDRNIFLSLQNEVRPEVVLAGLPPRARWDVTYAPKPGSPEAESIALLQPRDWVALAE